MSNSRRNFLKQSTLFTLGALASSAVGKENLERMETLNERMESLTNTPVLFTLPELPYGYSALEPVIDKLTMEIHHTKHHKAYIDNLNKALNGNNTRTLEEIMSTISKEEKVIRNNAGGHYNHSFFWKILKPAANTAANAPSGKIAEVIAATFGSFEEFKKLFADAGMKRFGSGWAWLYKENNQLKIGSTPNQDNPLMDNAEIKGSPLLALDVWEHAYYLKHQNKRADYINDWWKIVNWEEVNTLFAK